MSQFSATTEYGGSFVETNNEKLTAEEIASIDHVKVQHSKDKEGKVLDKLCMAFYMKNGKQRFMSLDRNSKLQANDAVKPESINIKTLERDGDEIYRVDGDAL